MADKRELSIHVPIRQSPGRMTSTHSREGRWIFAMSAVSDVRPLRSYV